MAHPAYNHRNYRQALKQWRRELPPCAICGQPTTAKLRDPQSVSVDHIRGVATFPEGTPAGVISSIANLRPTHLACNLSRARSQHRRIEANQGRQRHPGY